MRIFGLKDTSFAHCEYSAPGLKSEKMKWDRSCSDGPIFYTHEQVFSETSLPTDYALIFESQAIVPNIYNDCITHPYLSGRFGLMFTHSSHLLKFYTHTRWIPGGSIWVGGDYGGGEIKIYPKTKLCSMVSSDKLMCPLHKLRYATAEYLLTSHPHIDQFGTIRNTWVPIIDSLKDYKFSIVMENYQDNLYFTEKLLNCFATGTIPVYLGAKHIDVLFNPDGILQFNNATELINILDNDVNDKFYKDRESAIKENFELCKQYRLLEDFIVEHYL